LIGVDVDVRDSVVDKGATIPTASSDYSLSSDSDSSIGETRDEQPRAAKLAPKARGQRRLTMNHLLSTAPVAAHMIARMNHKNRNTPADQVTSLARLLT